MDALKTALGWTVLVCLTLVFATVVVPPGICQAEHSEKCCHGHRTIFDGTTWCDWKRTWHGPNAFERPLTPYYIPRLPDYCDYADCANGCGAVVDGGYVLHGGYDCEYELAADSEDCHAGVVIEGGFERLGQIPHDLELAVGAPAAASGRPGR